MHEDISQKVNKAAGVLRQPLPLDAARAVMNQYNLDQVIILARDLPSNTVLQVTYGRTKNDCLMAAEDGNKIQRMLEASPTSLEEAVAAAKSK